MTKSDALQYAEGTIAQFDAMIEISKSDKATTEHRMALPHFERTRAIYVMMRDALIAYEVTPS